MSNVCNKNVTFNFSLACFACVMLMSSTVTTLSSLVSVHDTSTAMTLPKCQDCAGLYLWQKGTTGLIGSVQNSGLFCFLFFFLPISMAFSLPVLVMTFLTGKSSRDCSDL